jgi:hypothetical protein
MFYDRGYCYGGFRTFPHYRIPILESSKSVLLVRDPRDMMTSAYFSFRESHVVPEGNSPRAQRVQKERAYAKVTPIDQWVREAASGIVASFDSYFTQGFTRRENVTIYRYEDVIFNKHEWVADMAKWYGWNLPSDTVQKLVEPHDIVPQVERPDQHIRQVHPGNYKANLSDKTIERIEAIFGPYMEALGYLPSR